jgi:hypothetical protein
LIGALAHDPLILISLSQNAPEAFEVTMNSLGYEYQSDFARRYYGQGKAEGKAEGRVEIILKLLALRFGLLTEAVPARVHSAQDAQLDAVAERVLTAQTLEEALRPLSCYETRSECVTERSAGEGVTYGSVVAAGSSKPG